MLGLTFEEYRLRPVNESDRAHLQKWIDADADHKGKVAPEFFMGLTPQGKPDPCIEAFLVEDRNGEPVFYFRQMRALRVDIQFGPAATAADRHRNREALTAGFQWLYSRARFSGFRQMIFQSSVAPLIRFCEKRLGFYKSDTELVRGVAAPEPQQGQEN